MSVVERNYANPIEDVAQVRAFVCVLHLFWENSRGETL